MDVSEQAFPNDIFIWTEDFVLVVKKLFWSCADVVPKGGHKKSGIEKKYPLICPLYDKYIYKNINISEDGLNLDDKLGRDFYQLMVTLGEWNINNDDRTILTEELLKYCKENPVLYKC